MPEPYQAWVRQPYHAWCAVCRQPAAEILSVFDPEPISPDPRPLFGRANIVVKPCGHDGAEVGVISTVSPPPPGPIPAISIAGY